MRYLDARCESENRKTIWMHYTADSLYYIPQQKAISVRYKELLKPRKVDNRSGEEIVEDIMKRGGLRFGE